MQLTLSYFELLIIIGMVTGVICSILLFKSSSQKPSNLLLGVGILGFVWLNTKILLHSFNLWEVHGFGYFPNAVELALPPIFYLYGLSFIDQNFKFHRKYLLYFIPFFLSQAYSIFVYASVMQTPLLVEKEAIAAALRFQDVKLADEYVTIASSMIYLYHGWRRFQRYKTSLSNNLSSAAMTEVNLINSLFPAFTLLSLCTITNLFLKFLSPGLLDWGWQVNHSAVAVLVYYTGLKGYKSSEIPSPTAKKRSANNANKKPFYQIDQSLIKQLEWTLEIDKPHLDSKLSLRDLAKKIGTNEGTLSIIINRHYQKNYRSFINTLRVDEVKLRLQENSLEKLSLAGLANECGFNSEASFYRIFKKETGVTPKQYLLKQT